MRHITDFTYVNSNKRIYTCYRHTCAWKGLYILYNVRWLLDQFWPPIVPCYSTEDAVRIVNSFVTIPITRTYIHSQLFLTLLHMYIAYNHLYVRSWLQSLITLLHVYTGSLLSYQLLSQIITHFTSSHFPGLAPIETSLVALLLNNSSRELTRRTA
jgi:hypothetical protein